MKRCFAGCGWILWSFTIAAAARSTTSFTLRGDARGRFRSPLVPPSNTFAQATRKAAPTSPLEVSGGAIAGEGDGGATSIQRQKLLGRSLLVFVALLYGNLYVCLRRVYSMSNPPTAAALSAARGWIAAACFLHLPFEATKRSNDGAAASRADADKTDPARRLLWLTAFDLAIWNFLAQGLTNLGLVYCPSARASFLIQSSVIFTPLLSLGLGQKVSPLLWFGVGLAFTGLTVLSSGPAIRTTSATSATLLGTIQSWLKAVHPGDALVLAGALTWSIYLLRLSRASSAANNKHQIEFPAIPLQAIKTLILAIMYTAWWVASSCLKASNVAAGAAPWWHSASAWFWLALSAIGPGAVADVLQQKGQQHVSATEANVIMSSEPVFTAVSGFLILGEKLATREIWGGAIILLAALVSSVSS